MAADKKLATDSGKGIFRNSNFLGYFGMNLTSRTASQIGNVVVIWVVFAVTQSALDVAVVGVAGTISTVLITLPAGVWVDRYNRRLLLLSTNLVKAFCMSLFVLLTSTNRFQLSAVIALVFIWQGASELYRSTDYSVLPDLVKPNELADANGITRAGYQLVGSVSSILGGALIAFAGASVAFLFATAGYALAVAFCAFLLYRYHTSKIQQHAEAGQHTMIEEIKEGFRWLIKQKGLFQLSVSAVVFNFLNFMPSYFLVVYVSVALRAGALLFGGIISSLVVGSAAGSLLVGRTNAVRHTGKVWILLYGATSGALYLLLGFLPSPLVAISASFAMGLTGGFGGNVWLTSAQNLVPSPMRGRYFAIDGLLSFIGGPPAVAVGGILVALIGVLSVYEAAGALLLFFAMMFAFMSSLWTLDGRKKESETVP